MQSDFSGEGRGFDLRFTARMSNFQVLIHHVEIGSTLYIDPFLKVLRIYSKVTHIKDVIIIAF